MKQGQAPTHRYAQAQEVLSKYVMNYDMAIDGFWHVDTRHKQKSHYSTDKRVYLTERQTQLHYLMGDPNDGASGLKKNECWKKLDAMMTMTDETV